MADSEGAFVESKLKNAIKDCSESIISLQRVLNSNQLDAAFQGACLQSLWRMSGIHGSLILKLTKLKGYKTPDV